jgi:hypothetical protein
MTEHGEPKGAAGRRYMSPPPASGSDRVTELLFQWETRHVGGRRRDVAAWWRSSNRGVMGVAVVATLFLLGAGFAASPQPASQDADVMALESRLAEAENALQARQGELELARLELNRLAAIVASPSSTAFPRIWPRRSTTSPSRRASIRPWPSRWSASRANSRGGPSHPPAPSA